MYSRVFPQSKDLITGADAIISYGPQDPDDCDSYSFGHIPKPAKSADFASEHILEWQLYLDFWRDQEGEGQTFISPNPNGGKGNVEICPYFKFWWGNNKLRHDAFGATNGLPVGLVALAYDDDFKRDEFMLLDKNTNGLKERLWGNGER
ncbi:hypothetical protein EYZ11_009357 [Aspergillus tanneri]|uniref:Uncharacterized protein n=1 Tax=Aspergillus tanneri TaxID=1220188 RepID=A0A4S3JA71_9EURO|nr:uncharacterized protein ATNIH1004_000036 [Aspergillus tanneri]KAA8651158.1 hypothetical protein ATNIH1004_000036 [Aspergillus tanneri]THC91168.1 hypothetical protein EYZ11_009357 [Aspergillus tanneri]